MTNLFDELNDMMRLYKKRIEEEGEQALKDRFKDFFETHPDIQAVLWTQYTPYFNDGDSCTFSVHDFRVLFKEEDGEEIDEDGEEIDVEDEYDGGKSAWSLTRSADPVLKQLGQELGTLSNIPEDVLESIFGDHVQIKATREGFSVNEYSHD